MSPTPSGPEDAGDRWSTPTTAPLVPRFPISYRDVRLLTAVYRTDPEALRRYLPGELTATSDLVMVHLYEMPDVQGMGQVNECNVMAAASFGSGPDAVRGGFTTALYISSDAGLAQGREIHGQPKKMGETTIEARSDLIVGTVHRNGIRIVRVTTPYKLSPASVDDLTQHFDFRTNLNLKVVRNIDGSEGLHQITARRLADVEVHECWSGPATVEFQANAQAPVYQLPVIEPLDAFYWRADFRLVEGEILADLRDRATD